MVSGKGGVGKTHLSAALSYQLSQKGRKVLLVEFSHLSLYSEFFSRPVGFKGVEINDGFYVASWTGLDCLSEYVASIAHSQRASDIFLKLPVLKNLIESAPGLREVAVLGKLTSDYRQAIKLKTEYDDIVFDAPSTGHFMSLLQVPFGLTKTVGAGPMQVQCDSIIECLNKSSEVKFVVVKDTSDFSQQEGEELYEFLVDRFPERKSFIDREKKPSAEPEQKTKTSYERQEVIQVLNFAPPSSSKEFTESLKFFYEPNELGWFMGAKELADKWEKIIDA